MSTPGTEPEGGRPEGDSDRLWALFDQASDLPPAEQQALLDAACADDPELRAELEEMLAFDAQLGTAEGSAFLKSPLIRSTAGLPADAASSPPTDALPLPSHLGRYRLIRLLGEGGMGAVYEAEQESPRRTVALKVVRPGLASSSLLKRFRHESQILGRLHHPGIAQVYEAGLADDGQPFFAMEFIRGLPLDEYARLRALTLPARVELLARVCEAVQHAHDHGIIHRDLKPANILVEETGQPKVLDFGVARATGAELLTAAGLTQTGQLLGTPNYMSPEQVTGDPAAIDHRADVHALGVILFELAAHRRPYRLENRPLAEVARIILEEDPPRLGSIMPWLRGDMETIVAKALEKEPARRYSSALALADDLRRWQNHEPILAKPPNLFGRTIRWCRRNPAVTTIVIVMALGLAGVFWQWRAAVAAGKLAEERRVTAEKAQDEAEKHSRDAVAAKKEAEEEAAAAREVANFLGGLFEEADPFILSERTLGEQPNTNPTAMEIVERGAKRLADPNFLKDKPLVRATLLDKVGHVFVVWGQVAMAEPFLLEALELREKHRDLPAVQADLATSLHNAGFLHHTKGNFRKSKEFFAAAVELRSKLFGSQNALTMSSRLHLGHALKVLKKRAEAERLLVEVADFQRAQLKLAEEEKSTQIGRVALEYCCTLLILPWFDGRNGSLVKDLARYAELQQVAKQITNKQMRELILQFVNAKQLQNLRQVPQADKEFRLLLEFLEKAIGKRHYLYTVLDLDHAVFLLDNGLYEEAEKKFLDLETTYRSAYGGDALGLADIYYDISRSIVRGSLARTSPNSDPQRHKELSAKVVRYARAAYDQAKKYDAEPEQLGTLGIYLCFALDNYEPNPDYAAIEAIAREAWGIREKLFGVGGPLDTHPLNFLLIALSHQEKTEELERVFLDLLARNPQPKWDRNASSALPLAATKLAGAGKTRTAVLMLEHAATTGEFDLNSVRTAPTLASLRESPDYQELLKKMKTPK